MRPEANPQRWSGRSSQGFSGLLASSGSLVASLQRWRGQRRNHIGHHQPQERIVRKNGAGPGPWMWACWAGRESSCCSAAAVWSRPVVSLRKRLDEFFIISGIGLTRCFGPVWAPRNVIDTAHSGMRRCTDQVTPWRDGSMAVAATLDAEKRDSLFSTPDQSHRFV